MKYSELISFNPIEDVIQLTTASDAKKAREYVKTYVMSDTMAESLKATVIDQLQMDEVVDNKGVLIVGNYGTGKSHLMSVISAVANDADNLQYLHNRKLASSMEQVAGKFEVLRIEIGGVTMSFREILFGYIKEDFDNRGIDFHVPDFSTVKDNKKLIKDMMFSFSERYPQKGYLIVIDEFLSYLSSRNARDIVLDLEFLRALGEMCSKSNMRIILGVQEMVFDNPRFSFVSDTLMHVKDRFTQAIITKEATSYVVSERILKKTPEQKALIRAHLERFSNLYAGMSSRMDEFVELFPIHPAYIDVFNRIYLIENRHILKNISLTIKNLFDQLVPANEPGIISFDNYWPAIKSNGLLRSDITISKVLGASQHLEDIINRSFEKAAYKPIAIQIIYALSVHRLTTNGLSVQSGLTAENLKDDLCLFLNMPEQDADFLLGAVKATLREIMKTVSFQFMIYNETNGQYYIDVYKITDYEELIKQKASMLSEDELNRYFYQVVYSCLEWEQKQYVPGFEIYEHDLNWDSHNIFREGYLFMGLPGERSTAQPERDFYIHIMPPYGKNGIARNDAKDEVYFYFKSNEEYDENLAKYAAAQSMAITSDRKDKEEYLAKGHMLRKKLIRFLGDNKNTCFEVVYEKERHQLIEILKGRYQRDLTFNDTIALAASIIFDDYFNNKYPELPVMKTKITRKNMFENAKAAIDYFAGKKTQQSTLMLQSFGILDGDRIRPEGSKYASHFIEKLKTLPPQGVINYSVMFEPQGINWQTDKKFQIWHIFTPIIFLSLVYGGYATITMKNGETLTASNLDNVSRLSSLDLSEFKYLSKPTQISRVELKRLFEVLNLNPAKLDNPNDLISAVEDLVKKTQELCNMAVIYERKISEGFDLWGEPLASTQQVQQMKIACSSVKTEFGSYGVRFNTPAKLINFTLALDNIERLKKDISLLLLIPNYLSFKTELTAIVSYIASIEYMEIGSALKAEIGDSKALFREIRDSIFNGIESIIGVQKVSSVLERIKGKYIDLYYETHRKKRLGIEDAKRRGKLQESITLSNLRKLRTIETLSSAKLADIELALSGLLVCYTLTPTELKSNHLCPHCRFGLGDVTGNAHGQLDNIESRIDALLDEWTRMLLDTISDPIVINQKEYLSISQIKVIDDFVTNRKLPDRVDDFFVKSIQALLKNYEPVIILVEDLIRKLEDLTPLDEVSFKAKINEIVSSYTKGKDTSNLRIVVKRKESEE